ncbi:hypothetical protein PR202_ga10810 [Eleusine coracana subsp. coracana]|uniref:Agenet-like domain-containing protein n=1 Tax=Eleusine coracana subsp. coracana TaxID=191504 RepID=A0AAV5C7W2_ELECO|nr:hypothetical protein PR202_ga10810 [Eleusine coracana subsp. coracana]
MFERFDLVEAYDSEGWWPGVVSAVRRGRWPRYTVTFPLFREEVELSKSLVRPRREFVCGTWIDAQVLRGIPLYKEGSSVEVMCDKKKQGTAWMLATIIKMVGGTNYVVTYGNEECSTEILHSRFVRQQPVFDMKFEYELEPSTEVEVYQDGIWTRGVIADVSISEPRRYGVRIKRPYSTDEDDYLFVSRVSLRPYSKWDEQKSWPSLSKKRGRKEDYAVCPEGSNSPESSTSVENSDEEFCSAVTSKANRDTDQYRSVPNKEPQLKRCTHLRKDTARSLLNDSMDIENHADTYRKDIAAESEESNGLRTAKSGEHILLESTLPRSIPKQGGGKRKHLLPKALASKRKDFLSISSLDDISKTDNKSSYVNVVVISDDSGCQNVIEIRDNSSSIPNRKKRRMNLSDDEIHSTHMLHPHQASRSSSNLLQTHNTHYDPFLEVARHYGEQPCSHVLSHSVLPQKVLGDSSDKDGEQLVPLPGCLVQGLLRMNEPEGQIQSGHLHSEIALMALDDSAAEDENPEMCQEVIEGKDKMDGTCREGDTISLANSENSNPAIVPPDVEAFSDGKLKPSSPVQQDVNADLLSMQVPYSSKMEIKHERTCMSAKGAPVFYHQTYMKSKKIADASLNHPLGQYELSISKKSKKPSSSMRPGMMIDLSSFMPVPATTTLPTVFSAGSLLLMPEYKMEVFKLLPQKNLHFHEVWNNYPRELREGQALGLMLSFANMAESIKNIRVEDDPQLYQEKMRSLLDLEDNGFEVGALKDRLDNLLCLRYHQIDLKKMKAHLNNEVLKLEISNTEVEQRLKFIRMYMMGLGEEPPQFRELTMQKSVNSSNILKLQDELHQVEDSLMSVEADFNNAAAAPWCLNAGPSVSTTVSNQ